MTEANPNAPMTMSADRQERRKELGQTTFQGGQLFQPKDGRELMDMANVLSQSGTMISPIYRGKAGDCAALIALCSPYGFNPVQVSWKTYKASKNDDAPIAFEAQLVNAMVNMSAPIEGKLKYEHSGEGTGRRCRVFGIDRESGEVLDYESPAIKDIKVKNSPLWTSDPDQQLGYFAARNWARRHFPEMLLGVYARDEMPEHQGPDRAKDVTPDRPSLHDRIMAKREEADQRPDVEPEDVSQDPGDADADVHQGTLMDIDEAEIVDALTPMPQDGFPGSDEFTEGAKAFQGGQAYDANPFVSGDDADQRRADDWAAGWSKAHEAADAQKRNDE